MAFEFRLPDIGEGVVEGEVVSWKVKEGDVIKIDQPMVEVMTDKATVEIPSPASGKVSRIMIEAGKVCAVGQVMIVIEDGSASKSAPAASPTGAPSASHGAPKGSAPAHGAALATAPAAQGMPPVLAHGAAHTGRVADSAGPPRLDLVPTSGRVEIVDATGESGRVRATPSTRRLARQLGVTIGNVAPTGKNGRVTRQDVQSAQNGGEQAASAGAHAGGQGAAYAPMAIAAGGAEERVPFRGVRKAIAANLSRSKATAAHFTYVEEVDMTDMVAVRTRSKEKLASRGIKLTYLPFICKAVIAGLKKYPAVNSSLDEATQEIVRKKYYHLGIATQGPQGLSVGVVRDADKRSIVETAQEIDRISAAIRDGNATREQLTGSTFTISSLGQLGGVLATPIINFPEAAILGVHKIAEKPAVKDGQIVIRQLMNLSVSVDHRIADGWDGAMFLQEVKMYLEDPTMMFLELV